MLYTDFYQLRKNKSPHPILIDSTHTFSSLQGPIK